MGLGMQPYRYSNSGPLVDRLKSRHWATTNLPQHANLQKCGGSTGVQQTPVCLSSGTQVPNRLLCIFQSVRDVGHIKEYIQHKQKLALEKLYIPFIFPQPIMRNEL